MKKIFFILVFCLIGLSTFADDMPGMVITKTDGSTVDVPLSQIQSIKFSDGNMVVNRTTTTALTMSVDEVKVINFSDVASAINAIVGSDNDNAVVTVTDLSGRQVYSGSKSGFSQNLHGIYIINGHKVSIK